MKGWETMAGALFMLALIGLLPFILFIKVQYETLKQVAEQNRAMPAAQVWLQLIPVFGLIWQFHVVRSIADSLRNELEFRNSVSTLGIWEEAILDEANIHPTFTTGQWYCITVCITLIPFIGFVTWIFALILWITYWNQLIKYKKMLQSF